MVLNVLDLASHRFFFLLFLCPFYFSHIPICVFFSYTILQQPSMSMSMSMSLSMSLSMKEEQSVLFR